jgi:hypothetical protein
LTKEEILQQSVADYLRLQYSKILFCHIANERKTSPARGAKLKRLGVNSGLPDVLVFQPKFIKNSNNIIEGISNIGLAIELKIEPNKPSENQLKVLAHLKSVGWKCAVCYSFDESKTVIDDYFN